MKRIIIPNKIFKISNYTHYLYLSNKHKKDIDSGCSKIIEALSKLTNVELFLSLKTDNDFKKDKLHIDFKEKYIYEAIKNLKCNLNISIENSNINIRNWTMEQRSLLKLNQLEINTGTLNHIHLNKYSFGEHFNNVNTIILHNVYRIHKLAWHPCSNSTFIIKNSTHQNLQVFPQVGLNSTLDLTNIKNINFIFPLFNIYFEGKTFKNGIDYYSILQEIIMGPNVILDKDSLFYESEPNDLYGLWNKTLSTHSSLFFQDEKYKYKKFSDILDFNKSKTIKIEFRNLWLLFAKEQLISNKYFSSQSPDSAVRRNILEFIIKMVEEAETTKEYNFVSLKSYKEFMTYISSISISCNPYSYYDVK